MKNQFPFVEGTPEIREPEHGPPGARADHLDVAYV